jgi:Ca2+-transporting ATPase
MAGEGFRVLGLAMRVFPPGADILKTAAATEVLEDQMIFLGLMGLTDPPREGVRQAVEICRQAGIRTLMITGDHARTAEAVARHVGMLKASSQICDGVELDAMDDAALRRRMPHIAVFARVSPRHKLRIVRCLKQMGHITAMTGDGVNDAPAVKEADIGISMGFSGTDVTRGASDLVLSDDNFSTIMAAIEEGRIIYENIRKFIQYLLAGNIGEVLLMTLTLMMGLPLPLLPIQILWVNLVTDGLPAMALSVEKGNDWIMLRKPRDPKEGIFARGLGAAVIFNGILIAFVCLGVYVVGFLCCRSLETARTMAFCALVLNQILYAFECGSYRNGWLLAAGASSLIMQLSVVYIPFLQRYFKTAALPLWAWSIVLTPLLFCTLLRAVVKAVKIGNRF